MKYRRLIDPHAPHRLKAAAVLLGLALVVLIAQGVLAQSAPAPTTTTAEPWDVTKPRGVTREISFTTSEGTWMSVDLSPDGKWIVFDLLAHIYRMPASGGQAVALTQDSGIAVNFHPRYSPDGQLIAFISDRGGQNNLWVMNADGTNPRAVYKDLAVCVVEPAWTADGRAIVVRRQGNCHRGEGAAVGLWMYPLDGGQPTELVARDVQAAGWPFATADGKYLYFHYAVCPAYHAGRNDLLRGCMQIKRLDLETKVVEDVTTGEIFTSQWNRGSNGSAIAPAVSPDGRWLSFSRRIPDGTISFKGHKYGPRAALWLRDLKTGAERVLMDPIETDLAHGLPYAMHLLPTYDWANDSASIVISQGGKIRRVNIGDGSVQTIPFSAPVHRTISQLAYAPIKISDGPFEPRFLRWPTMSPSKRQVAFQTVGKIWMTDVRGGSPRRLTPTSFTPLELSPAWSPDGKWIAFTTWDEKERGHLWRIPAAGGAPERLTADASEYLNPVWKPDGSEIVVSRGPGVTARGRTWSDILWYDLVRIPAGGGAAAPIVRVSDDQRGQIVRASFGPENRLYYAEVESSSPAAGVKVKSVKLDGTDVKVHTRFPFADEIAVSPDGKWLAFSEQDNVYVVSFPQPPEKGDPPLLRKRLPASNAKQLSFEGGLFPRWVDADTLEFGSGQRHFTYHVSSGATDDRTLRLTVSRPTPKGTIAFTGARILTMDGRRVIESGDIVVQGSRITCVGTCDKSGARVISAEGKTIIPGLIDMHAHHHYSHRGITPPHNYESVIYLAYGITTTLDPAAWSGDLFPEAESIEAGFSMGPRTYTAGDVLHAGEGAHHNDLTSYEMAEREVNRRVSWGCRSLKDFLVARRDQRQWLAEAVRKRGDVMLTGEGGSLEHDLSMVMDGHTGWEHDLTYVPIYSDVAKFVGQAKVNYSITLITDGPGPLNEEYFWQESDVWKDPKQRAWLPWWWLIPHTRVRWLRPKTDYTFPILAQGLADIIAEGGYGAMGGHGDQHGIGSHWETWMMAEALGPMGALEVATVHGARFLGASSDLGSISTGKLADLVILNSNPLENVRNTADIKYVMKGGVLYDANSLDEIWPQNKPFGERYWANDAITVMDDRPTDYWDQQRK